MWTGMQGALHPPSGTRPVTTTHRLLTLLPFLPPQTCRLRMQARAQAAIPRATTGTETSEHPTCLANLPLNRGSLLPSPRPPGACPSSSTSRCRAARRGCRCCTTPSSRGVSGWGRSRKFDRLCWKIELRKAFSPKVAKGRRVLVLQAPVKHSEPQQAAFPVSHAPSRQTNRQPAAPPPLPHVRAPNPCLPRRSRRMDTCHIVEHTVG